MAIGFAILAMTRHRTPQSIVVVQKEFDRILSDMTAASLGTSGALSAPAVTIDRARLPELCERLGALLPYRR